MAIDTLNVDGVEMKVNELPESIQRLIAVYESTHNERVQVENKHIALSASLRQLSADISAAIRQHKEANVDEKQMPADTEQQPHQVCDSGCA